MGHCYPKIIIQKSIDAILQASLVILFVRGVGGLGRGVKSSKDIRPESHGHISRENDPQSTIAYQYTLGNGLHIMYSGNATYFITP